MQIFVQKVEQRCVWKEPIHLPKVRLRAAMLESKEAAQRSNFKGPLLMILIEGLGLPHMVFELGLHCICKTCYLAQ